MKEIKYIEDIDLKDLPNEMLVYLDGKNWDKMPAEQRLREMTWCIGNCGVRYNVERSVITRKRLRKEISVLSYFCKLPLRCSFVYMLVTADRYEYPLFVDDTLIGISRKSGFNYEDLKKAFQRKGVFRNRYRVVKVDIREFEDKFNYAEYNAFCKRHGLKSGQSLSLKYFYNTCKGC